MSTKVSKKCLSDLRLRLAGPQLVPGSSSLFTVLLPIEGLVEQIAIHRPILSPATSLNAYVLSLLPIGTAGWPPFVQIASSSYVRAGDKGGARSGSCKK